jgi:hypothetical protein
MNKEQIDTLAKQYLKTYPATIVSYNTYSYDDGFADIDNYTKAYVNLSKEELNKVKSTHSKKLDFHINEGSIPFGLWDKARKSDEKCISIDSKDINENDTSLQEDFARVSLRTFRYEKENNVRLCTPSVDDKYSGYRYNYDDAACFLYVLLENNATAKPLFQEYFSTSVNEAIDVLVRDVNFDVYKQRLFSGPKHAQEIAVAMERKWLSMQITNTYRPEDIHKYVTTRKINEIIKLYIPLAHKIGHSNDVRELGADLAHFLR